MQYSTVRHVTGNDALVMILYIIRRAEAISTCARLPLDRYETAFIGQLSSIRLFRHGTVFGSLGAVLYLLA
jgi:hypothetical protein